MPLSHLICKNTKPSSKAVRRYDSGGLYLEISPSGGRLWRLKYHFIGKEKRISLGKFPEVTLAEAREKRDAAKKMLADGKDPSQERQAQVRRVKLAATNSFESVAREWHGTRSDGWVGKHALVTLRRLERDVFPVIGKRAISEISAVELLQIFRAIEARGTKDLPRRVLQICSAVFRFAVVTGRTERDPTPDLKGALKVVRLENYRYLPASELPSFLTKLEAYDGEVVTKLAFHLMLHTFVRTRELRGARWSEIDLPKAEWRIPGERMKMGEEHVVPLSRQATRILSELRLHTGFREYIFPNRAEPRRFMSENTLLFALYRMGYHGVATVHGFRSTASTILNEHDFNRDVIERQLAHQPRDRVRAAYNRAQYLTERRRMMQWWSDYLSSAAAGRTPLYLESDHG